MIYYITNKEEHMKKSTARFERNEQAEMKLIKVYPTQTRQSILGFGGAFTEAAAYTFSKMKEEVQEQFLNLYFGEDGNRYNFCRTHIQSCDFSLGNYAYIDDEKDTTLSTFSLERDQQYLIPLIKRAQEKNGELLFLASPWSPPAFMKSNLMMNQGGKLLKKYYQMWADMFVKYLLEYKNLGIDITRVTIQNEPQAVQTWDSCIFKAEEEKDFACNYLKPSLIRNGLTNVKIIIWDHNKDCILERVESTLNDEKALKSIDGIAFHWYSGDHFEALQAVKENYPEKELLFTEGCVEYSRYASADQTANAQMYAHDMIGNINAGTNGFIDWNMLLDGKGGPNHVGNFCDAPIMYNETTGELDVKLSYYYIGHFSRFVKAGAKRMVVSRYRDSVETVGFVNPDGERVLVLLNRTDEAQEIQVCEGKDIYQISMTGHSIVTCCW